MSIRFCYGAGVPAQPTAPRPLRRDAQHNRDRIVQAARELFAERGLEITLNDVAHHAGVGVGTVYRRFPHKDALVEEIFESRLAEVGDLMRGAAADPDPWRGFTGFLYGSLELQAKDRALGEIILGAPLADERVSAMRAELVPIAAGLIDRARAAGQLRADFDVSDLPVLLLMVRTALDLTRDAAPDAWRRFAQIALEGVRPQGSPVEPFTVAPIGFDRINEIVQRWRPAPP
jgi:AcrR family transcriptional regulator